MLFQSREFRVPKDYETPQYYEDASAVNVEAGRAAIADGVSSAVFSASWAQILTQSVVTAPPDVHDTASFGAWLAERRKEWAAGIDVTKLPYHLLMKLRQVGGGFATLAWIDITRDEQATGTDAEYQITGRGVGDSCVFHVRESELVAKWPMEAAADFDADPLSIGSMNPQFDPQLVFQEFAWQCRDGDLLVLATDAIAAWVYKMIEAEQPINWHDLAELPDEQWTEYIAALRDSHWLKRDDTTLIFIGLGRTTPFVEPSVEADAPLAQTDDVTEADAEPTEEQATETVSVISTTAEESDQTPSGDPIATIVEEPVHDMESS